MLAQIVTYIQGGTLFKRQVKYHDMFWNFSKNHGFIGVRSQSIA